MALEDIFSDVLLDTNYYLEPHLIDMTAEIHKYQYSFAY